MIHLFTAIAALTASSVTAPVASLPGQAGQQIVAMVCRTTTDDVARDLGKLPGIVSVQSEPLQVGDRVIGRKWQVRLENGRHMTLDRIAPGKKLRGLQAELTDAQGRPEFFFALDQTCSLRLARALHYDENNHAIEMIHLDGSLRSDGTRIPINPPLPAGMNGSEGVRVALVDSGVNYLLPAIHSAIARDQKGRFIGYDFWDMDDRPFDVHNPRSMFLIQRHGTRTASLVIKEAPRARIVPYRYPRPAMERMRELITHASKHNVRIMAIPLGSNRSTDWHVFARVAAVHPNILFIASAGNNGRNIDHHPVYPAVLTLNNLITVTSADDFGRPAERANWGPKTVDLLVPAERRPTLDFDGKIRPVSGSSYAVSRIAALAVRLLAKEPALSTAELKTTIFNRALDAGAREYVHVGYIPDPLADTARIVVQGSTELGVRVQDSGVMNLDLHLGVLQRAGWTTNTITSMVQSTADILVQCGIKLVQATLHHLEVPDYVMDFDAGTAKTLIDHTGLPSPTIFLVRDSNMEIPFDGEAFGHTNSTSRPWLRNTVWLLSDTKHPGIALAHELFHVLTDSGEHVADDDNLMRDTTSARATRLSEHQCRLAREIGFRHGLIKYSADAAELPDPFSRLANDFVPANLNTNYYGRATWPTTTQRNFENRTH